MEFLGSGFNRGISNNGRYIRVKYITYLQNLIMRYHFTKNVESMLNNDSKIKAKTK